MSLLNNIKNNLTATTAPLLSDDLSQGYSIGSFWYDTITGTLYYLVSNAVGASFWSNLTDSPLNKGWFATESALTTAYPVGENGWYAIVGSTDTIWLWDGDTAAWLNTGLNGAVSSVNTKTGVVVLYTSDISATTDKNYITDAQQTAVVNFAGITTTLMTEDVQLTSSSTNIQIITGQTVVDPDPIWSLKAENSPVDGRQYEVINSGDIYAVPFRTFSGDLISWVYTGTKKTFVYSSSGGWIQLVEGSSKDGVNLGEDVPLLSVYVDNLGLDGNTLSATSDVDINITAGATKKVKINSVLNNSTLTASEIVATNSLKDVVSLPVAEYPSLPELAHVKGVASAILL